MGKGLMDHIRTEGKSENPTYKISYKDLEKAIEDAASKAFLERKPTLYLGNQMVDQILEERDPDEVALILSGCTVWVSEYGRNKIQDFFNKHDSMNTEENQDVSLLEDARLSEHAKEVEKNDQQFYSDISLWMNELSRRVFHLNESKGFWEDNRSDTESLALIHSELSEALEALREEERKIVDPFALKLPIDREAFKAGVKDTFEDELADAAIRLFDLAGKNNIPLGDHIVAKLMYNKTRPYKHGKKF